MKRNKNPYCTGASGARRLGRTRSKKYGGKLLLAFVTLLNLILSIALVVINRQEVLRAVKKDERVEVLLSSQKETKS